MTLSAADLEARTEAIWLAVRGPGERLRRFGERAAGDHFFIAAFWLAVRT